MMLFISSVLHLEYDDASIRSKKEKDAFFMKSHNNTHDHYLVSMVEEGKGIDQGVNRSINIREYHHTAWQAC